VSALATGEAMRTVKENVDAHPALSVSVNEIVSVAGFAGGSVFSVYWMHLPGQSVFVPHEQVVDQVAVPKVPCVIPAVPVSSPQFSARELAHELSTFTQYELPVVRHASTCGIGVQVGDEMCTVTVVVDVQPALSVIVYVNVSVAGFAGGSVVKLYWMHLPGQSVFVPHGHVVDQVAVPNEGVEMPVVPVKEVHARARELVSLPSTLTQYEPVA
jgi:hypothetical protein